MFGTRADEVHVVLGENFREAGVLGQKAVARMNGVRAGNFAGGKQRRNVEIAVDGRGWADADAFVGKAHVHGVGVRRRVNRNRRDAEFLARPQNAQRDLPTICDQDFVEHLTR